MSGGAGHSDDTRAAVLAALQLGESVKGVSRTYRVTPQTVRRWRDEAGAMGITPVSPPDHSPKKRDLGVLVGEYLAAGLAALAAQAVVAADPEWIKKQPADQLAIFHGVLADKLIRVLAAVQPASPDDAPEAVDVAP